MIASVEEKVNGNGRYFDEESCRRHLDLIMRPGRVFELRCPDTNSGTLGGWFDNPSRLIRTARYISEHQLAKTTYITLNPVDPSRWPANNEPKTHLRGTADDTSIA